MLKKPTSRRSFLKASTLAASTLALRGPSALAQSTQADAHIEILPGEPIATIAPEIYSHFIEHLGGVMYEEHIVGRTTSYAASYAAGGLVHHDGVYRTDRIGHDDIAPPDQVHTIVNPEHLATGRAVLAAIGGSGLLNLNLLEDDSGRGWVHDLNLRPWGTVIALREAGVDFADDYLRIHRGLGPRREDGSLPAGVEAQIFPSAVLGAANRSLLAALRLYLRLAPRYRRWTSLGYLVAETARSAGIVVRDRFRRPMPLPAAHESPAAAPEAPWCGR